MSSKLVVGLGNPGNEYSDTRHNVGFMVLDRLLLNHLNGAGGGSASRTTTDPAESSHIGQWLARQTAHLFREERGSLLAKVKISGFEVLLAKPQTFMNRSGESVQKLMAFYKISLNDMLVVHDDVDQSLDALKFQANRGPGGHNGLKSLNEHLGSQEYARLKFGVGKPADPRWDTADWVLSSFSSDEMERLLPLLDASSDACVTWMEKGTDAAANKHNRRGQKIINT